MLLFPGRTFHIWCYGVMALSTAHFIATVLASFLFCTPLAYNWDKYSYNGTCYVHEQGIMFIVLGIVAPISDVITVAMPFTQLYSLQMSMRKKLGLAVMFGLGAL